MTNNSRTIHEAAQAIRSGSVTPLDLVEQCLGNVDRWESKVRAWVFVDRDYARAEAKRLTAELHRGSYRGQLHGIPIGVKDIYDVFDWPTAAGSKLWANSIARQDSEIVRRLRHAGAIFLGKTVTTQFASFDPPITRNPWNLERTPGGSSSGSAAALAVGMCLGALGSQTGGSITRPASYCGVAGLKPSYGQLPLDGIVPLAPSMDHPGPMARCVRDLGILFQAMGGPWQWPNGSGENPILVRVRGLFDDLAEPAARSALDKTCVQLRDAGARISEWNLPSGFADVLARHRIVMAVEAAQFHRERLERHPEDYLPKIRSLLEEGLACPAPEFAAAKEHQKRLQDEMLAWLADGTILITPATTGPAPAADSTGNPAFNSPWSYTGLPTVSIPTGQFVDGMPLALQLAGCWGAETRLLQVAEWCEQALGAAAFPSPRDAAT
ncbi:MAG: amidase [Gemmataceae bacterium]|nr:amidase [Gemmataceae bacterium]